MKSRVKYVPKNLKQSQGKGFWSKNFGSTTWTGRRFSRLGIIGALTAAAYWMRRRWHAEGPGIGQYI